MKKQSPEYLRIPPQAVEVEKHVIGGLCLDGGEIDALISKLSPRDFYLEKNAAIYAAMQRLHQARKTIDLLTISDELRRFGDFDRAGGDGYLMEISSEVVSSANILQHADIIKEKAIARDVIGMATRILEMAYEGHVEGPDLVRKTEEQVYRLGEAARGMAAGLIPMPEAVKRTAHKIDRTGRGEMTRTRTGILAIDAVMHGFEDGGLYVLAARPGVGKSALALQSAVQCGLPVPLFSLEMMIEEEVLRLTGQLDPALNANGLATQAQVLAKQQALQAALLTISKYPIEICDSSQVTVPLILSECRRMKRRHGRLGMIVVDYLQMIETAGKHSRRDLEVGDVSKGLKRIGNELGTAVLAVASLSRKCEERENKRPIDIDLRDAGQIESDAHGLIFLYSEARYSPAAKEDPIVRNIIEVGMPKNRGGDTGQTLLEYCGPRTSFSTVSSENAKYYRDFISGKSFNGPTKAEAARANGEAAPRFPRKSYATGSKKTPPPDAGKQTSMIPPHPGPPD